MSQAARRLARVRRPRLSPAALSAEEQTDLQALYDAIRKKETNHEEALRDVLTRVFVSPEFLFRIEHAPADDKAGPVNDWELAAWLAPPSCGPRFPIEELRKLAAEEASYATRRCWPLKPTACSRTSGSGRWPSSSAARSGCTSRGFGDFKEKNEKLFPTFDANSA